MAFLSTSTLNLCQHGIKITMSDQTKKNFIYYIHPICITIGSKITMRPNLGFGLVLDSYHHGMMITMRPNQGHFNLGRLDQHVQNMFDESDSFFSPWQWRRT
jgi:hypothetical protein